MELFDYQKKAIEFIHLKKKVYLALDMGMGKTLTSLASQQGHKILLIAEKNEIVNSQNFKKEVHTYFPDSEYYNLREEIPDVETCKNNNFIGGINPEGINKLPKELTKEITAVIIDEATLAKTTTTQKFKKVKSIVDKVDSLVLLSGTPMLNGASEMYAPLLLMDNTMVAGKGAKGKKAFEKIFAGGHYKQIKSVKGLNEVYVRKNWFKFYSWWAKGANNVRELRYLLQDSFFIMNKSEAGGVFKNKVRTTKEVEMSFAWLIEYNQAWSSYLEKAKKRDVNLENIKELKNLIENGQCYQVNSKWKAEIVARDIASGVYGDKRIVVFSKFIETDALFQKHLKRLKVSFKTFDELQDWKKGDEQVLVGRIGSHNKGGNVPEASVCLFIDMDFVPSNNMQAENRIDRPEQKNEMLVVYYLTQGDSIVDTHIRNINKDKARKIADFMKPLTEEEIAQMPARIETLREKFYKEMEILGI